MEAQTLRVGELEIPRIGFGTWELTGTQAQEGVRDALELGYRHIDTARIYGNEREVGTAIGGSGIDRGEIFLATKLWFQDLTPAGVRGQLERSLRALGTDYVDLLLIHWPNPELPLAATLDAMAELWEEGKARALGVSNFPTAELKRALKLCPAPLIADQVEMHPYLDQTALLSAAERHELALEAYSPLANGALIRDETLAEISAVHGKSGPQVALRWLLEHPRVVVLPRSSSRQNRAANLDVLDFELSEGERDRIAALARPDGRQIDPPWAPEWD